MVRAGEVSPTELVQLYLDRIERLDPQLNAFRKVFAERALLEAEQAEARLKAGEERPLLGVPIAIKDEVDVAGEVNTHGTDAFTEPAKADCRDGAAAARGGRDRRRHDAAARAGDLRLHRVGDLGRHPQPLEPAAHARRLERRLARAAVAAGLVPIASAGDGAGSIRIPAASCGLFGLKPPRGRVSLGARRSKDWNGLAVNGCLSRTVLDTALWLDVVSRRLARSPRRRRRPSGPSSSRRRRRRASCGSPGRPRAPRAAAPPTVADVAKGAVADAAELLRSLGHEVAQRDPDWGGIGNNITARFLRGVAETSTSAPPRAARTPHARLRPARRLLPDGLFERAMRGREADAARVNAIFDVLRRADDAGDGRDGAAGAPLGGQGRAADACSG